MGDDDGVGTLESSDGLFVPMIPVGMGDEHEVSRRAKIVARGRIEPLAVLLGQRVEIQSDPVDRNPQP
jgi:hypothetical protein